MAAGADVKGSDTQGRTALHGAAMWGLTDVVKFVHENGADINAKDKRGLTPLNYALGQAGGFGFDGKSGVAREETAKAIRAAWRDRRNAERQRRAGASAERRAGRSGPEQLVGGQWLVVGRSRGS